MGQAVAGMAAGSSSWVEGMIDAGSVLDEPAASLRALRPARRKLRPEMETMWVPDILAGFFRKFWPVRVAEMGRCGGCAGRGHP